MLWRTEDEYPPDEDTRIAWHEKPVIDIAPGDCPTGAARSSSNLYRA
jgi:hypothetical protein